MKSDCEHAVSEFLGRPLRPGEARTIENAVKLQMRLGARRNPAAWQALSADERLQQGAEAAAKSMLADVARKQQIVRLKIAAHDRIENQLAEAFERLPDDAKPGARLRVVSQLLAFDSKGKGLTSVETWGHAIGNEAFGQLLPLWNAVKGFAHLFEDPKSVKDLVHELFGEDSGNAAAKGGAAAWLKTTDALRDRANAAGMDVGKLDEWHYPQSHSQARVAAAGIETWLGHLLPLLDREKYLHEDGTRMSDDAVTRILHQVYDSIITDGQNKVGADPHRPPGYGITAGRMAQHRVVFFKDADSYLQYQGDYGDKSLWPTLTGHLHGIARDIALNEVLGPDAEGTFKYFNDRTRLDESREHPQSIHKVKRAALQNEALLDMVSGKTQAVNQKVRDAWQSWRNWQVASKLGKVVFTALGDEAGMSATAFANKVPWSESFAREFTYLNPTKGEDRAVAQGAGLGVNGLIGGLNRFGAEDLNLGGGQNLSGKAREFTAKMASTVLRASGAEAMWDARRQALGSVLMSYLGKHVADVDHFADINPNDHGMLASKGVSETDWKIWKQAQLEDWGMKHGVLTPKAVAGIGDAKLDEILAPEHEALRNEMQSQVEKLEGRNEQERERIQTRADALSRWVKEEIAAFSGRVGAQLALKLPDLKARMERLGESLDYASSYWKNPADPNTPGISGAERVGLYGKKFLRDLGVNEGKARQAIDSIRAEMRGIDREMQRRRGELSEKLYSDFHAKQKELQAFTDVAQDRMDRRTAVMNRLQAGLEQAIQASRDAARRHASTLLLGHVLEETGMGVMDTGARERLRMTWGTMAGTAQGELTRSVMLFKGFSASMMMKHWGRAASMERSAGAQYAARLIVMGTIMGAAATQLRNFVSGKDPANVAEPQFWAEAILRGGGLGFYGDFLYGEATSHDTNPVPAALGPLWTDAEQVSNLTLGNAFKHYRGERTDEGAKAIRFGRSEIPLANLWYTQAAADHLIWNDLQEAASPGYLDRMQQKAQATRGTTYFWDPHDKTPARAPDIGKAWQPERGAEQLNKIAEALPGVD